MISEGTVGGTLRSPESPGLRALVCGDLTVLQELLIILNISVLAPHHHLLPVLRGCEKGEGSLVLGHAVLLHRGERDSDGGLTPIFLHIP